MNIVSVYLFAALLMVSSSYRMFQDQIPNGGNVPHPCKPNYIWRGVGHQSSQGGGLRNPFGRDFEKVKTWTKDLCRMDSDNDGMTNGQELGDPDCKWSKGQIPTRVDGISHPGVCDPWGSEKCAEANSFATCDTGEFICNATKHEDVFNITLRFPPTTVPAQVTTLMCFSFALDMLDPEEEYHLIATQPYIDNVNVMHHSSLAGCSKNSQPMNEPEQCNMVSEECRQFLSIWTLGLNGECWPEQIGFKIGGKSGIQRIMMQHHWNNPTSESHYVDSSGVILHLTKKLRQNNAGFFIVGETKLDIPAGRSDVRVSTSCTSSCTQSIFNGSINLISGWNHMHYLGIKQNVAHYRNGVKLQDLTPDEIYNYDSPKVHSYNPLVEIRRGDNLETTCHYRSTSRKEITRYGEGTFDEMCFTLFTIYPVENLIEDTCVTWEDIHFCHEKTGFFNKCDMSISANSSHPERKQLYSDVLEHCKPGTCESHCRSAVNIAHEHPCVQGSVRKLMIETTKGFPQSEAFRFYDAVNTCATGVSAGHVVSSTFALALMIVLLGIFATQ